MMQWNPLDFFVWVILDLELLQLKKFASFSGENNDRVC